MKVRTGVFAGYGPDGTIHSWGDESIDVDDNDEAAVGYWERMAADGVSEILEPAKTDGKKKKVTPPAEPAVDTGVEEASGAEGDTAGA